MTPVETQFHELKESYPHAEHRALPDGTQLITIPEVKLPQGKWSKPTSSVRFLVPVGYPASRPDCFWSDPGLMLANGQVPQNTGANPIPHDERPGLWFSWHVASWSPNSDSLLKYLRVIFNRFEEAR